MSEGFIDPNFADERAFLEGRMEADAIEHADDPTYDPYRDDGAEDDPATAQAIMTRTV